MQERYVQFIELVTTFIVTTKNSSQVTTSLPKKTSLKTTTKTVTSHKEELTARDDKPTKQDEFEDDKDDLHNKEFIARDNKPAKEDEFEDDNNDDSCHNEEFSFSLSFNTCCCPKKGSFSWPSHPPCVAEARQAGASLICLSSGVPACIKHWLALP
jgi:hypothetical protein